jgi:hypothetical protein
MNTVIAIAALANVVLVVLLALAFWRRANEIHADLRDALHTMQLQLAFIAGRIGLDKRDLDRAADVTPEPDVPTEVVGQAGDGWEDLEEDAQYAPSTEPGERHE